MSSIQVEQRALPIGWRRFACVLLLAGASALIWPAPRVAAQVVETVKPTLVQTIATSAFSPSSPDPAGITYIASSDRFLISDSEVDEMSIYQGKNLFTATRFGSGFGSGTTRADGTRPTFSREPTGLGFNPNDGTLFVSDDDADKVSIVRPGPDGVHGTADDTVTQFSTAEFGGTDSEGVEYDPATGDLFICAGIGVKVYRIDPVNGAFGDGDDVVTSFGLAQYGSRDCEGIGLDAQRGTVLAVDPTVRKIYEVSKSGGLVRILDLSTIPSTNTIFAGVTTAPTSDPADSPSAMNYWVVDRHVDNGIDPFENDGLLYELSAPDAPPETSFSKVPNNRIEVPNNRIESVNVTYRFRSNEPGSKFRCKIDNGPYKRCSSPKKLRKLKRRKHIFRVFAIDAAGNADPTPAKDQFRVTG